MSPMVRIPLRPGSMAPVLGDLIRDTRLTIGWSQDELADRSLTSQTKIHRIETNKRGALDLDTLDRVLAELGLRVVMEVDGVHVRERREQRDAVHAALVAILSRRLRRAGWQVATEVPTGGSTPTGWMDILAYRKADGALLMVEVKTAIPDVGALLRQVAFYERESAWAARRMGWAPQAVVVVVVCLDTAEVRDTLGRNRDLLATTFPAAPDSLVTWAASGDGPVPSGRAMLAMDLRRRRGLGLHPSVLHGRRAEPAFRDYADAATALRAQRRATPTSRATPTTSRATPRATR